MRKSNQSVRIAQSPLAAHRQSQAFHISRDAAMSGHKSASRPGRARITDHFGYATCSVTTFTAQCIWTSRHFFSEGNGACASFHVPCDRRFYELPQLRIATDEIAPITAKLRGDLVGKRFLGCAAIACVAGSTARARNAPPHASLQRLFVLFGPTTVTVIDGGSAK